MGAESFEAEYPKYREYKGAFITRTAKNRAELASDMWDTRATLYKPRKKGNWILKLRETHPRLGDEYKTEVKNFTEGLNLYLKLSDLSPLRAETVSKEMVFNIDVDDAEIENEDELEERGYTQEEIEEIGDELNNAYDKDYVFEDLRDNHLDGLSGDITLAGHSAYLKSRDRMVDDIDATVYYNVDVGGWLDAETFKAEHSCPICKGEVYGNMSMIGEEIIPDICGDCDIYIMPQGISCIECGFGDTYGSATPCESCEPIAEKMKMVNMDAETYDADEGYVQIGTMQSTPADGYNGYMKMMRDARSLVEIGNMTGLNQKLGEAYQDETGRWFLPILQKNAETVGNPSPSSPLEETPATVPSPAEPTNENFEAESKNTKMVLGITALGIGLAFWKGKDLLSLWDRIKEKMD